MNNLEIYPKNYTDRVPYFYIVRHKNSGMLYAGSRWKIGCTPKELFTPGGYLTSSKRIKEIINKEGLDSFEIYLTLTEAECGLDVFYYETRFLRQYNISNRTNWYNGHDNFSSSAFNTTSFKKNMKNKYGFEYSSQVPEIKTKMRASNSNKTPEEKIEIGKLKSRPGEYNGMYGVHRFGEDNPFCGQKHTEKTKKLMKTKAENKVVVKDSNGNHLKVQIDDPRYISGELIPINSGFVVVKNSQNENFRVSLDDPRYVSGELIPVGKNRKMSQEFKNEMSLLATGTKWYNNGYITKRFKLDPGGEWIPGRIKWAK